MTDEELHASLMDEYERIIAETLALLRKKHPLTKRLLAEALYKANLAYWTARLSIIDIENVYRAEKQAAALSAAYTTGAETIAQQVRGVYANYQSAFNLTKREAENYLRHVRWDRSLMTALKAAADKMPDGQGKNEILAQISAPAYRYRIQRADEITRQAQEITDNIARGEINADRVFLQTEIERAYNITVDDIALKTPAQAVIRGNVTPGGIQGFTQTTTPGVGDSFALINSKAVKEITEHTWDGQNFSERIWANTDELALEVKKVLLEGELTGASEAQMAAKIQERFDVSSYKARRVIRTEHNYCINQAYKKAFIDSGYDSYKFMSLHEARDCSTCDDLDGHIFKFDDAVVGVNYPPIHPFCRCTILLPRDINTVESVQAEIDEILGGKSLDEWLDSLPPIE